MLTLGKWPSAPLVLRYMFPLLSVCTVDIGILMDESGSMSEKDFGRQKNFVTQLASRFQLGPKAAQFGIVTFSTQAQLDIPLNRYGDLASFERGVNAINRTGNNIESNVSDISFLALTNLF